LLTLFLQSTAGSCAIVDWTWITSAKVRQADRAMNADATSPLAASARRHGERAAITISPELHLKLKLEATRRRLSVKALATEILVDALRGQFGASTTQRTPREP
jgi:hypothetical protein